MQTSSSVILGCGDVGRRIALRLMSSIDGPANQQDASSILACARSAQTSKLNIQLGIQSIELDLETAVSLPRQVHGSHLYYLVPPPKQGSIDSHSTRALELLSKQGALPKKIVLISTTGVYGDCDGEWVNETTVTSPKTERGQRRLDSELQWSAWCEKNQIEYNILRVPGIYSFSRIPRQRLEKRTPVVSPQESGYSNRIHADDLAMVAIAAMRSTISGEVFNATDGTPGKMSEYLQAACAVLGLAPLPEISMGDANQQLSPAMLSYLSESRKISNKKMLDKLKVTLTYPDFRVGLRH